MDLPEPIGMTAPSSRPRHWLASNPSDSDLTTSCYSRIERVAAHSRRIKHAVRYLLNGAAGSDRRDIVREIIEIVTEVARGLPPGGQDPLDDGMPGG
jgi:hypothetical protein